MKRPLHEAIKSLRGGANFAMPGHRGRVDFDFDFGDDWTEVTGADNLLDPTEAIAEAQAEIAAAYGVKKSVFVPAGSTTGIKLALYLALKPGEKILIQRNSHQSLFHGAVALDLHLSYLPANVDEATGLFAGVDPADVERALDGDPSIAAVFLTSPDYFGGGLKLKEIADIVHARDKILIVDEAHGAHWAFTPLAKFSAVNYADYTVQSLHKTMAALTGAALLHINGHVDEKKLLKGMGLFLSTSPSYLLMLSSEYAVAAGKELDWEKLLRHRARIERNLPQLTVVKARGPFMACEDPMKFLFHLPGYRGDEVVSLLAEEGVYLEMGDGYYALAILSPYHEDEDVDRLIRAIHSLPKKEEGSGFEKGIYPETEAVFRPREAFFTETEIVSIAEAKGRVAAQNITPYPPGIPVVIYGERITEEVIRAIKGRKGIPGFEGGKITVIKEAL